jgi:rhodanese-related sulfurtransferase
MKQQILILVFIAFGFNSTAQSYSSFDELKNNIISKTIPLITVEELKKVKKTTTPLLILYALEENEFNVSHLKNAKYVGYDNFKIKSLKNIDKETMVVVYCSVGYRSEKVGEKLKKAGFKKVMNLQGGVFDWVNKCFPVYDNSDKETQKTHGFNESWGKWITKGERVYE